MASSAMSDRSTGSGANDRWSARLSRSNASVRSIARALTAWRRSTSSSAAAARIVAGDVEQGLRDRQRRAQFVGGVGGEPLLFGDVGLEPCEHRVEGVGELAELVVGGPAAGFGARAIRSRRMRVASVMRVSGASIRPASSHPPTRPNTSRNASTAAALGAKTCRRLDRTGKTLAGGAGVTQDRPIGDVTQQEHPDRRQQQAAGEHEEAGVAEGELEANAQAGGSIHGLSSLGARRRCGTRRRRRW